MMENENTELHCERCREEILEALYQLNVEAKKYADGAASAYNSGMKTVARSRSLRKKSLYGLKTAILREFVESECVDSIKRHEIDGELYYCFTSATSRSIARSVNGVTFRLMHRRPRRKHWSRSIQTL